MKFMFLVLLSLSFLTANAESEQSKRQRMVVAERLILGDANSAQAALVADVDTIKRHANTRVVRAASRRINVNALVAGFDSTTLGPSKQFVQLDQMLEFRTFDGDALFLENIRTYQITPDVVGWIGVILSPEGNNVGSAGFELFSSGQVYGHFRIPNRMGFEIVPASSGGLHDIVEYELFSSSRRIEYPDSRTEEQKARSREDIDRRLSGPEYEKRLRRQEEMFRMEKERQNQKKQESAGAV